MRRNGKVLAHVAGPSGAGKTELMNRLEKDIDNVILKDLDEYDDLAIEQLGWTGRDKNNYTDAELNKLHRVRQSLIDRDIENITEPIIFFGHHVEGDNVTRLPTRTKILLDVSPGRSAVRVGRRPGKGLKDVAEAYKIAKEDREYLKAHGYKPEKPAEVFNHLKRLAEKNPGVLEALGRIGTAMGGLNSAIDAHDKLVKKRVIRPVIGGRRTVKKGSKKNPVTPEYQDEWGVYNAAVYEHETDGVNYRYLIALNVDGEANAEYYLTAIRTPNGWFIQDIADRQLQFSELSYTYGGGGKAAQSLLRKLEKDPTFVGEVSLDRGKDRPRFNDARFEEEKPRKNKSEQVTRKISKRNPVTHLDLPDDLVARLGQEQIDAIFASEDPAGTIDALMTRAAQENDYWGLNDYTRLLAIMLAGGKIETEAREVEENPRYAEGRRVRTKDIAQGLTGYVIEGKRGLIKRAYNKGADVIFPDGTTQYFDWSSLRANPSYLATWQLKSGGEGDYVIEASSPQEARRKLKEMLRRGSYRKLKIIGRNPSDLFGQEISPRRVQTTGYCVGCEVDYGRGKGVVTQSFRDVDGIQWFEVKPERGRLMAVRANDVQVIRNPSYMTAREVTEPNPLNEYWVYVNGRRVAAVYAHSLKEAKKKAEVQAQYEPWQGQKLVIKKNPSYTVSVSAPSINESVDVKGPFLTTGGALRKGKARLRSAVKVHPKYSVEKNSSFTTYLVDENRETTPPQFLYSSRDGLRSAWLQVDLDTERFFALDSSLTPDELKDAQAQMFTLGWQRIKGDAWELPEKFRLDGFGGKRNPIQSHEEYKEKIAQQQAVFQAWRKAMHEKNFEEADRLFLLYNQLLVETTDYIAERGEVESNPRKRKRGTMAVLVNSTRPIGTPIYERERVSRLRKLGQIERLSKTANNLERQERAARESGDFDKAEKIGKRANKIYDALKKARASVKNGTPEIPSHTKSKLNKVSSMFHGPHNPAKGKVTREYISDHVKARNFSRAGSIPGIKLETDATGKHADPSHMCEECTIITNPNTSKLGISTGLKVQPMGKGVHAAGKRLKNKLDRMSDVELSANGVKRVKNGGYDLGKANTQWYTTIEKWSDIEDPDLINYYHEWAEETRAIEDKPNAMLDENGMIYFRGGKHTVTEAGIEN